MDPCWRLGGLGCQSEICLQHQHARHTVASRQLMSNTVPKRSCCHHRQGDLSTSYLTQRTIQLNRTQNQLWLGGYFHHEVFYSSLHIVVRASFFFSLDLGAETSIHISVVGRQNCSGKRKASFESFQLGQ